MSIRCFDSSDTKSISFLDCAIRNLRLWSGYPVFNKLTFNPIVKIWQEEKSIAQKSGVRYRPFDSASATIFDNTFIQNLHKVHNCIS